MSRDSDRVRSAARTKMAAIEEHNRRVDEIRDAVSHEVARQLSGRSHVTDREFNAAVDTSAIRAVVDELRREVAVLRKENGPSAVAEAAPAVKRGVSVYCQGDWID